MAVFVYGVAIKKEMSVIMILSTFIAVGITKIISSSMSEINLKLGNVLYLQAIIFAVFVFVVTYFLISNGFLISMVNSPNEGRWWWLERILFGLSFSGLFIVSIISFLQPEQKEYLMKKTGNFVQSVLVKDGISHVFWTFFPFVLLFFSKRSTGQ